MAGDVVEEKLSFGVPHDELLVYEESVRRGRALVVAATASAEEADAARNALKAAGAQSVDAAREDWAVGLRNAGE